MVEVDVCIPAFGQPWVVLDCLESVARNTQMPIRLIVVNDGQGGAMTDAVRAWSNENPQTKITLLLNKRRQYFVRCCNMAATQGKAPAIAFLHPSVRIEDRQWVEKMLMILRQDSRARCVTTLPFRPWSQDPPYVVTKQSFATERGLTMFRRVKGVKEYYPESHPHDSQFLVQKAVFEQGEHFWIHPSVRVMVNHPMDEKANVKDVEPVDTELVLER